MTALKMVVTRGEDRDVAEWTPVPRGEDAMSFAALPGERPWRISPALFAVVASSMIAITTWVLVSKQRPHLDAPLTPTSADLQAVHAGVKAAGKEVRLSRRLSVGDRVETDGDGRARLRLDDGTSIVIDRDAKLVLTEAGFRLEGGRVFVDGASGAHTAVELGEATAIVSATTAAIELRPDSTKLYAPAQELLVRVAGQETTVPGGETATIAGGKLTVRPERGFDDWTHGMAVPWSASGAPRRAVGELWGRSTSQPGDAGSPLTIRSHDVRATIAGEVAQTEVRTVYFNGGSESVRGDFRMALPPGAIVRRFASGTGDALVDAAISLADRARTSATESSGMLEWAGEGWLRGSLAVIAPGATTTVVIAYTEWLSVQPKPGGQSSVVQYRYPMASGQTPPLIGEFSASIDAMPSRPVSIASGFGAEVVGQRVEVQRPDFRPTADLVVDVELPAWKAPARLYVAPTANDRDAAGTILVRTEVPAAKQDDGVTLALVVDSSLSIDPALLDAERSLVRAILEGLGARDRAVVLAADQSARPLGPATLGPVDPARRRAIGDALAQLSPGGATDLGRALEAAADLIPSDAPAGMVVYIGDGWPTVGDATATAIAARLSRRALGAPRLGAVAVGPLVNRLGLAALVRGSGPLLEVADSSDAAHVAVDLIADALKPTVAGVELDLGPAIERVYPRRTRAVVAGETVSVSGRLRGELPSSILLRYRDASGVREETRAVVIERSLDEGDVARRWAAARVEELALQGRGREAATDIAMQTSLLTPWTAWVLGGASSYVATPLQARTLDLAASAESGFAAAFGTQDASGALLDVPRGDDEDSEGDGDDAMKSAIRTRAAHIVSNATSAVRACRDSRAALRPEIGGALDVRLVVDGEGHATDVRVQGRQDNDAALNACVKVVVEGLVFPDLGVKVTVEVSELIALPPPKATLGRRKCSTTSTLPMPLRRGVWKERLDQAGTELATVYLAAKNACELPTWTDRRALLELILLQTKDGMRHLQEARALEAAGDVDAATLMRREAVRRASSPQELAAMKRALVGDERLPYGTFKKRYRAAGDDKARLAVVRRYLALAPHDARLHRRVIALLEALGMKQELADEVRRLRQDVFADANLLADGASALRRIGDEAESRRAFGELAERAPADPWARAFLGDRLRDEGLYDDAIAAYAVLGELVPNESAAVVRLALAHAGAGHLDVAGRMLGRVAATGGRHGSAAFGELAGHVAAALTAEARGRSDLLGDDAARLARVALELPSPREAVVVLLRGPAGSAITATLKRGPKEAREERGPYPEAPAIGLWALSLSPRDTNVVLSLARPAELLPARSTRVHIDALIPQAEGTPAKLATSEVELPATGKRVDVAWDGSAWTIQ
jgi:tetratricopeptide (TPR) repeat protein